MTVKCFLEQYRKADRKARKLFREYMKEQSLIDALKSPLGQSGEVHGSGISKSVEQRAIRLADKSNEYREASLEALEIRQEIVDAIKGINGREYDALYEYYVDYYDEKNKRAKTWEDVANIVGVDPRSIFRIRLRAFGKMSL